GRLYPQRAERPIGGGPMSERPRRDHARGGGSPDREQRWDGRGPRSGQPSTAAVKAGTLELVVLPSERRSDCAAVRSPNSTNELIGRSDGADLDTLCRW